jgi:hypothetical protein
MLLKKELLLYFKSFIKSRNKETLILYYEYNILNLKDIIKGFLFNNIKIKKEEDY